MLESIATEAGLTPERSFDTSWAFEHTDAEGLGDAMISPGVVAIAVAAHGEEPVRDAVVAALEQYRTPEGGYRLSNEWHYLVARA